MVGSGGGGRRDERGRGEGFALDVKLHQVVAYELLRLLEICRGPRMSSCLDIFHLALTLSTPVLSPLSLPPSGPAGTAAATAGIKWIVKDGVGALGRFVVGGRLGREFDDDPRYWRMMAEAFTTAGEAGGDWGGGDGG